MLASELLPDFTSIEGISPLFELVPKVAIVEKSIDIQAPVQAVYERWTRFHEYSTFLDDVIEVRRIGPGLLRWRARIGGRMREWQAEIVENVPRRRLAWVSRGRPRRAMAVTCHEQGTSRTRVMLRLDWSADDLDGPDGQSVETLRRIVDAHLRGFKAHVETS